MKTKKVKVQEVEEVKETSIAVRSSPAEMIRSTMGKKATVAELNSLLDLQMKHEQNEARKSFAKSFAAVQENIRAVVKKSINPQTKSKYANLEGVIEASRPVYTKEGFSVIFYEGETTLPEHVRICADVLHNMGHRETYHYDVPLDGKGIQGNANMTKIHGKASSVSYARRYLMCMIWNLPTMDDDGNAAGVSNDEPITEAQAATIKEHLLAKEVDEKAFLKYMKCESLDQIMASQFTKAITAIKNAKGGKK
jgi:hypothetical protein